jgi:pimeloyl-ACP methyl ester carboxylesterase/DNA-binding CsgD family transcriptional regulator
MCVISGFLTKRPLYHRLMQSPHRPLVHELRFTHLPSGARIAWARSGRAGAPVLLRAAHWMTHVDYDLRSPLWQPFIERLGRQLEVVRYDERGCGLSMADDVPLSLDTAVEEIEVVADAHGVERFALLGISGGAAAAVFYAARHPERVSHLVLLGGYTHGLMHRNPSAQTLAFHEAQLKLIELGWGRNDPSVQAMFTSRFMPGGNAEQIASFNEHQRMSCDGLRAAAIVRAKAEQDSRALAAKVQAPTLVLHCEDDLVVPLALGHELAASIPGARFELLHSRNHLPLPQEPAFERLCQVITEFVAHKSPPRLTPRERELASLVGQGLDNLQIAARLGLADKTVRNMLSALYTKLGVEGRAMAVVKARDMGL